MNNKQYTIKVSASAPLLYPTITSYAFLWYENEEALDLPPNYPHQGEWGEVLSDMNLLRDEYPMPFQLNMMWLSLIEQKFYYIGIQLPVIDMITNWEQSDSETQEPLYEYIVVGMAPYGKNAIWIRGVKKSKLMGWYQAVNAQISLRDFNPNVANQSIEKYCSSYIDEDERVKMNLKKNGLPPRNLFDKYMQQFCYRYVVKFDRWNRRNEEWRKLKEGDDIPVFDYMEEALFDGTHDKLHDGGLLKYHEAGKPKKLAIAWHINKSEYVAYFWFEDEEIRTIYDRFYGVHPDTQVDFIIHIDAEKKKYQLALYRSGLQQPVIIPERAYQLIVFKSKFENYRSDNYNQESGAWIW